MHVLEIFRASSQGSVTQYTWTPEKSRVIITGVISNTCAFPMMTVEVAGIEKRLWLQESDFPRTVSRSFAVKKRVGYFRH